mmetsp:Transcript_53291/g.121465  ORF Transcript_53291/g.121465 Transcript_53291/m.121465 type:complete len:479 (-) Transcript_53291:341-1777(-)
MQAGTQAGEGALIHASEIDAVDPSVRVKRSRWEPFKEREEAAGFKANKYTGGDHPLEEAEQLERERKAKAKLEAKQEVKEQRKKEVAEKDYSELDWQQKAMRHLGCGGKKKDKVQTHVKHAWWCFILCPCCPVWRPSTCEHSRPWALGAEFVRLTLLGTLQYIPFSILVTAMGIIGAQNGTYHEGHFALDDVYLYNVIIRNWSQCWALYCLGLFYLILHDELSAIKPVFKFSMIKIVVILMWDQQVAMGILEKSSLMKEADDSLIKRGWTPSEVGLCINNFLVLIEMLFIGIGMSYAFHYTEWASEEVKAAQGRVGPLCAFWRGKAVATAKDVAHDIKQLGKGAARGTRYMVKKETWQNFGAAMKAGPGGGARARKSKGGYEVAASEDPGASSSGGEKLQFLTLPRLMSGNEIFLLARAAHSVGFWDVIRAAHEVNVLEDDLKAQEVRAEWEREQEKAKSISSKAEPPSNQDMDRSDV